MECLYRENYLIVLLENLKNQKYILLRENLPVDLQDKLETEKIKLFFH